MSEVGEHVDSLLPEYFEGLHNEMKGLRKKFVHDEEKLDEIIISGKTSVDGRVLDADLVFRHDVNTLTIKTKHPVLKVPVFTHFYLPSPDTADWPMEPVDHNSVSITESVNGGDYSELTQIDRMDMILIFSEAAENFEPTSTDQTK